jgi:hypothetical protein
MRCSAFSWLAYFHSKIVNYEGKGYIAHLVTEETRGVVGLHVTVSSKMLDEALIGNPTCLGYTPSRISM